MLTPKESARLFDMNHRLRNLHTQQAQALRGGGRAASGRVASRNRRADYGLRQGSRRVRCEL